MHGTVYPTHTAQPKLITNPVANTNKRLYAIYTDTRKATLWFTGHIFFLNQ